MKIIWMKIKWTLPRIREEIILIIKIQVKIIKIIIKQDNLISKFLKNS